MAVGVVWRFAGKHVIATALARLRHAYQGVHPRNDDGRFIGPMLGKRAEILGGVVLIELASVSSGRIFTVNGYAARDEG